MRRWRDDSRPPRCSGAPEPKAPPAVRKPKRDVDGRWVLPLWGWAVILWLSLPIIVMIVFGFNNTTGKFNIGWQGFTLHWYRDLFAIDDLTTALVNSLDDRADRHGRSPRSSARCWASRWAATGSAAPAR